MVLVGKPREGRRNSPFQVVIRNAMVATYELSNLVLKSLIEYKKQLSSTPHVSSRGTDDVETMS
jgi:hypothetical protein